VICSFFAVFVSFSYIVLVFFFFLCALVVANEGIHSLIHSLIHSFIQQE